MSSSQEEVKANSDRPYSWTDETGTTYRYYKNPLRSVCGFILVQEACERLAFYGLTNSIKPLLRDRFGVSKAAADSFVLTTNGLIYVFSLISAIIADSLLGVYKTILLFSAVYMGGLVLMVLAVIPGSDMLWMIYLSQWGLFAMGSGGIKSCVSVLGGQQFSPVDHKEQVTSFFTMFYASINIGALIGGFVIPAITQEADFMVGYIIPAAFFAFATAVLIFGSKRYVMMKPQGSAVVEICKVVGSSIKHGSLSGCRQSKGGKYPDLFIEDFTMLVSILPAFALAIPFNISYNLIFSVYETQAITMSSYLFGWKMPEQWMMNVDPIAIIIGSLILDNFIFPFLRKKNMMPTIMQRFVIGYILAALANFCATMVELSIIAKGEQVVPIWAQVPQFSLIAIGEIFVISTSYEIAFTKSPEPLKTVGSACNLVAIAIANFMSQAIGKATNEWTENGHYDYFYILYIGISLVFAGICFASNKWFEKVFARADAHVMKTRGGDDSTVTNAGDAEKVVVVSEDNGYHMA
jgi:dipeptide/tripeptide permease